MPIVGVVGAGVMGRRGIAQVAAESGMTVLLADTQPRAVLDAIEKCRNMIRRKVNKGQLAADAADAAISRIHSAAAGPEAGFNEFASCDLVIEAVVDGGAMTPLSKLSGTSDAPLVIATVPKSAMKAMAGRLDESMPVGNEGAGVVVKAGAPMRPRRCSARPSP